MKITKSILISLMVSITSTLVAQNEIGIIYTPFDTTFYYQGNSGSTGFSDDLTYCFDINKDSVTDIFVTLSWDPHYDIKTRVLLSTNDFHNDSLGWFDTPDYSYVLSDYDYQYIHTWPPALEYHYPDTVQYHYGFIKKVIDNNCYYGWYIMRGIWSSDYNPGITFSILESAYCIIPNYPLRWGQREIYDNIEESSDLPHIIIYPNPASGIVSVCLDDNTICQSVEIFSLDGRLVKSQSGNFNAIDISSLAPGLYMINVKMRDGREYNERIVKE